MSKSNYSRSAGSSLVPRTSALNESERQEALIRRVGKGKYYASKSHHIWKEVHPRMTESEKVEQCESLRRKARVRLIKELVEG